MKITLTVDLPEKSPVSYTPARSARLFEAENAELFTLCQAKSDLLRAKMVLISEKVNQTSVYPTDVLPVYIADIEQSRLDFLLTLYDVEGLVEHLTEDIINELDVMSELRFT